MAGYIKIKKNIGWIIIAAICISLFIFPYFYFGVHTTDELSIFSEAWDGHSKLKDHLASRYEVSSTMSMGPGAVSLLDPSKTVLVIIGPWKSFNSLQKRMIDDYVSNGGILILADDFGTGNQIATEYGAQFIGEQLFDMNYEHNPNLTKIEVSPPHPSKYPQPQPRPKYKYRPNSNSIPINMTNLTLLMNKPTALTVNSQKFACIYGSNRSWIGTEDSSDINRDYDAYPVIAMARIGKGHLICISDASMFINDMLDRYDNEKFIDMLVDEHLRGKKDAEVIFYDCNIHDILDFTYASLTGYLIYGGTGFGIVFLILVFAIVLMVIGMRGGETTIPAHVHAIPLKGLVRCLECNCVYEADRDRCPNCGYVFFDTNQVQ